MAMSHFHHVEPKPSCKVEEDKADTETEKEVGRQHYGMDQPGVRQVSEGSGEQENKWRKQVVKLAVVPQRPSRLRGG